MYLTDVAIIQISKLQLSLLSEIVRVKRANIFEYLASFQGRCLRVFTYIQLF